MKSSLKAKLTSQLGLKAIAIAIAILAWIVIANVEDYKMSKTIRGIPVEKLNGNVINDFDKVYDVIDGDTVDIIIKGRRTLIEELDVDDFIAQADLSKMTATNTVQINVSTKSHSIADEVEIICQDSQMVLRIEDKVSKQLPVMVVTQGVVADGHSLGKCIATPNIVTVEGPESVIDKITEIRAIVNISGATEDFVTDVEPKCYDIYGESMDGKNVTVGVKSVQVSVPVYKKKSVELGVSTYGRLPAGYKITNINYHPTEITIAGTDEELSKINKININDISVSGKSDSFELNVSIEDYLPSGIFLADNNSEIAINIIVEKLINVDVTVDASAITLLNKNENYDYEIILPPGKLFTINGLADVVSNYSNINFGMTVDCEDLVEGENIVSVDIKSTELYTVTVKNEITIIVTRKNQSEETGDN